MMLKGVASCATAPQAAAGFGMGADGIREQTGFKSRRRAVREIRDCYQTGRWWEGIGNAGRHACRAGTTSMELLSTLVGGGKHEYLRRHQPV
jgi:hypothetical protein